MCILLNFLLLYRIPIIIKRIKFPVKKYLNKALKDFSTFIKSFKQSNINTKIEKIPQVIFVSICSFLGAPSLSNLSADSKSLSLKALSNLIWKEKYETIYIKHLKKVLLTYEFIAFSPEKYGHYKEDCFQVSSDEKLRRQRRDKLLSFQRIIEEETIESILAIPHLLLLP